jgi:ParB-like chromosome segregation protein Spo0J
MSLNPIENIEWIDTGLITANDYNPNVVLNAELKLLEFSIIKNGWIQPILLNQVQGDVEGYTIIDGFHRYSLAKMSKVLQKRDGGKVPGVVMNLSEAESKLLTIRINRAKGSHIAYKMSEIIKGLVAEGLDPKYIATSIGATKKEIDLLMMEDVFKMKDTQNHEYSKAWYPK